MRRSRAEWTETVAEFRLSGESSGKFAASRGLRESSLKWWCWRLRAANAAAASTQDEVRLVPVDVVERSANVGGAKTLVLAIADVEIRVEVGTDITYVAALVREVRTRC